MSTEGLVYSPKIPLDEFCRNLISARAYAAWYFDSQVLFVSSAPELVCAVEDVHPYLDAHMDTLNDFGLSNSHYGLALHGRVAHIINLIPTVNQQQEWTRWRLKTEEFNRDKLEFDVSHCLPGEEEYTANASHCIAENDLRPFWMHSLPAPHRPQVASLSAKLSADVAITMPPCPTMIRQPKPAIPPASSLKVEVHMLPSSSVTVGSSTVRKRQRAPEVTTPPSINLTQVKRSMRSSKAAQPAPPTIEEKPTMRGTCVYVSDGVVESESGGEGDAAEATISGWDHEAVNKSVSNEIVVPPFKRLHVNGRSLPHPPPPHAYHPVMGEPLSGLKYVSFAAFPEPAQSLCGKVCRFNSLAMDVIDNMIYSRAFCPSVDLQYHEPPSCQALESMKLSLLPAAPDSLTKPVGQICSGREYVYRCHSDQDPYFICPPLLNWPCFNCTLAGYPDQCIFKGGIREECCTKCKSSCHGHCSACWDANQLRQAATLLDPLTLSGDAAICRGVQRVDHINSEIELLGRAMQSLHEDREAVIGEIVDGLDTIACCEHRTEIVDAYSQVSGFLKSFIVHVGGAASESSNGDVRAGDD
ncbi:hypothetical protein IW261DRAFT_1570497 [Armillaria novae-zelandiae]|uniref:Uncharacterized protein n=1 Tax=Armillaria novae-zelandiae TaxID=153914 RepID=A0AA39U856_9AGAR|nr:hypothetical protein IW261DRAFT_1570497 [Armillaria novae-zelandiae]